MKLRLPLPSSYVSRPQPPGLLHEAGPELRIYVAPVAPLPYNLQTWGDEIVLSGLPLGRLAVRSVVDAHTGAGWPLTLIESDVLHAVDHVPEVRRIHALYRFLEFGVVAIAISTPAYVEAHRQEIVDLLKAGEPDLAATSATSIADFFAEVPLAPPSKSGGPGAST